MGLESRDGEEGFRVEGSARRFLEYNKNIQLGHFMEASMLAIARRAGDKDEAGEDGSRDYTVDFLRALFSQEFIFSPTRADEAWKLDHQAYADTLCSLLDSYLEAYLVACGALRGLTLEEPVATDAAVEMCFSEGERMIKEGIIRREESLSRVAFKNATRSYRKMGLLSERQLTDDGGKESVVFFPGERFGEFEAVQGRIAGLIG